MVEGLAGAALGATEGVQSFCVLRTSPSNTKEDSGWGLPRLSLTASNESFKSRLASFGARVGVAACFGVGAVSRWIFCAVFSKANGRFLDESAAVDGRATGREGAGLGGFGRVFDPATTSK